ncbi:nucleotidyltransferase [Candidatus Brocadia pituitae]|nr:nucleotidyltransferase [Candidatus Brocadia pituitae]
MERLVLRYKDALRALHTLGEILQQPFSTIVRDATIQRFEYTFEALWKFFKDGRSIKEIPDIPFMNHSILIKIKKAWRYVKWKK